MYVNYDQYDHLELHEVGIMIYLTRNIIRWRRSDDIINITIRKASEADIAEMLTNLLGNARRPSLISIYI